METVLEHNIEAEIAGAAPRRAHLTVRMTLLLAVAYLLLGLFIIGSGRALWEAGKLGWVGMSGRTIPGKIAEIHSEATLEKNGPKRQTAFRYSVIVPEGASGASSRTGWIGLERKDTRVYRVGEALPYRIAPWFGGLAGSPWAPVPTGRLVSLLLCGFLVLLVSALLIRRLTLWLQEHLHLLRLGTAAVGTIIHKRTEAEDVLRYFLRYGYAPTKEHVLEREEQVSAEQWREFEVGQPVTVLYDPAQPECAGLYALMRH
jgi:hypothetical protein